MRRRITLFVSLSVVALSLAVASMGCQGQTDKDTIGAAPPPSENAKPPVPVSNKPAPLGGGDGPASSGGGQTQAAGAAAAPAGG
jgi:hypothetical protein